MISQILYQDENVVAVNKPVGIPVIPGRNLPEDLPILLDFYTNQLGEKLWVVHRIDRETSGLLLFARNADAHRTLSMAFESREIKKRYSALVAGCIATSDGHINTPLKEFGSGRVGVDEKGKECATFYRVVKRYPATTLLEVKPLTGRRHQIRAHLYSIAHPIAGDPVYGNPRPVLGFSRLMLHAATITLPKELGGVTIECPVDVQWEEIVKSTLLK